MVASNFSLLLFFPHSFLWNRNECEKTKVMRISRQPHSFLWNRNECGKNKSNENFKTSISSKNYDKPKTTRECGIF